MWIEDPITSYTTFFQLRNSFDEKPVCCSLVYAVNESAYSASGFTFIEGTFTFKPYIEYHVGFNVEYWKGHMTDRVKLQCTFGTETVLSPELDLYTCSQG